MLSYVRVLRPLNLLILAFSIGLAEASLYSPGFSDMLLQAGWGFPLTFYFITASLCLAACGYIINDYYDYNADQLKSSKSFLSSPAHYLWYYYILFMAGLVSSVLLFVKSGSCLYYSTVYFVISLLLFIYSSRLKSTVLFGNILVALLTALPFLLLAALQADYLDKGLRSLFHLSPDILFFASFAFFINLIREIAKDVEDADIDRMSGIVTFANTRQLSASKWFILICSILILIRLAVWMHPSVSSFKPIQLGVGMALLFIPAVVLILFILLSRQEKDFTRVSRLCKLNMFLAMLFMLFLLWT